MYSPSEIALYVLVGKLTIYILQIFPLTKKIGDKWEFFRELTSCGLCFGVWIFTFYALVFRINLTYELGYVPLLSELITGVLTSFIVHLVSTGFQTIFYTYQM